MLACDLSDYYISRLIKARRFLLRRYHEIGITDVPLAAEYYRQSLELRCTIRDSMKSRRARKKALAEVWTKYAEYVLKKRAEDTQQGKSSS